MLTIAGGQIAGVLAVLPAAVWAWNSSGKHRTQSVVAVSQNVVAVTDMFCCEQY